MKKSLVLLVYLTLFGAATGNAQAKRTVAAKPTAAITASVARGREIYTSICLACHQADGSGVPHLNPPLTPNDWIAGPKPRLIDLVLNGSQGNVEIDGDTWSNAMPAQPHLTDVQIADVLTYVRNSFGNKAGAVAPAEVKARRAKK